MNEVALKLFGLWLIWKLMIFASPLLFLLLLLFLSFGFAVSVWSFREQTELLCIPIHIHLRQLAG